MNRGNVPTFITKICQKIIDLVILSYYRSVSGGHSFSDLPFSSKKKGSLVNHLVNPVGLVLLHKWRTTLQFCIRDATTWLKAKRFFVFVVPKTLCRCWRQQSSRRSVEDCLRKRSCKKEKKISSMETWLLGQLAY